MCRVHCYRINYIPLKINTVDQNVYEYKMKIHQNTFKRYFQIDNYFNLMNNLIMPIINRGIMRKNI